MNKKLSGADQRSMKEIDAILKQKADEAGTVVVRSIGELMHVAHGSVTVVDDAAISVMPSTKLHFPFGVELHGQRRVAEFALVTDAIEYAGFLVKKEKK